MLASYFLKERLNLLGKLGCACCIIGSTVMVIHSPRESDIHNMEELRMKMAEPGTRSFSLEEEIREMLQFPYNYTPRKTEF